MTVGIDVDVPRDIGGGSGGSGGGSGSANESGSIVDSRFDGAFLAGFSATNGTWRVDADGLWVATTAVMPSPASVVTVRAFAAASTLSPAFTPASDLASSFATVTTTVSCRETVPPGFLPSLRTTPTAH